MEKQELMQLISIHVNAISTSKQDVLARMSLIAEALTPSDDGTGVQEMAIKKLESVNAEDFSKGLSELSLEREMEL